MILRPLNLSNLRKWAQEPADRYGVNVLLITNPPDGTLINSKRIIPYITLTTFATGEERQSAIETFTPKKN